MAEVDRDGLTSARRFGAWRHEMDGKCPPLAVGRVRRGAVQGLTVVKCDTAGRQVTHDGLAVVDQLAHVEEDITTLGLVVDHGAKVRARNKLHCAVVQLDVVESEPTADQIWWKAFPVGIVLVPKDGSPMVWGLVQRLVVEELYVGSDDVLNDVEDSLMVGKLVEAEIVLGDLHELEHLLLLFFTMVVVIFDDSQVADGPFSATPEGEFFIVLLAHLLE